MKLAITKAMAKCMASKPRLASELRLVLGLICLWSLFAGGSIFMKRTAIENFGGIHPWMDVECSDLSNWVFVGVEGGIFFFFLISVALKLYSLGLNV